MDIFKNTTKISGGTSSGPFKKFNEKESLRDEGSNEGSREEDRPKECVKNLR